MRTKKILDEYQKNMKERIIYSIVTNGKEDYIDIREYFYSEAEGQFVPSKKGVCIKKQMFDMFVENYQK